MCVEACLKVLVCKSVYVCKRVCAVQSVCVHKSVCVSKRLCVKASMCVLKASVGVWVCVCVFCTHTPFLQNSKRSMPVSRRLARRFL